MVDLEEGEGLCGDVLAHVPVMAYLRIVAYALEQAVRQAGGTTGPAGDLGRTVVVDLDAEDACRASDDVSELGGSVIIEAERHTETVAQRTRE